MLVTVNRFLFLKPPYRQAFSIKDMPPSFLIVVANRFEGPCDRHPHTPVKTKQIEAAACPVRPGIVCHLAWKNWLFAHHEPASPRHQPRDPRHIVVRIWLRGPLVLGKRVDYLDTAKGVDSRRKMKPCGIGKMAFASRKLCHVRDGSVLRLLIEHKPGGSGLLCSVSSQVKECQGKLQGFRVMPRLSHSQEKSSRSEPCFQMAIPHVSCAGLSMLDRDTRSHKLTHSTARTPTH